ncbi:hypothetical protein [Rothia mucilaginosa]|uniref:hypothetical protein n=1 Tax=Rothia mucilaginosa TaxID=43675 RepID=UPI0028D2B955|nr:hypothetical protein [Rothia mucilaginosa]
MEISVERYHYPVGQGIFSAQIVRTSEKQYVCVYDCGSSAGGKNIEKYTRELYEKTSGIIDLLVISHLDDDHVNGVRKLYKERFRIEKVVLPYMTRWERILYVLSRTEDNSCVYDSLSNERAFFKFIINNSHGEGSDDDITDGDLDGVVVEFSDVEISRDPVRIVDTPLGNIFWEFVHFSLYSGEGDIFESNVIDDFAAKIRENYEREEEFPSEKTFSIEELRNLRNIYNEVYDSHRKNNNENRKALNSNRSSIILYSGFECESFRSYVDIFRQFPHPFKRVNYNWIATGMLCTCHIGVSRPIVGLFHGHCCKNYSRCFNLKYHNVCEKESYEDSVMNQSGKIPITGWLGTGDAELSNTDNCWELVHKLGMWRMRHVREITVPHHGGNKGSCPFLFHLLNGQYEIICIIHSKISGMRKRGSKVLYGKYGHPIREVCKNIWEAGNLKPVHVTEDVRTKYQSTTFIDISW